METRTFFKRYAYVYFYAAALSLLLAAGIRSAVTTVSSRQEFDSGHILIIDPGHGGMDGGAVSCSGERESRINLQIAQTLEPLMRLVGCDTVMTRTTADSVATEGKTIREQKRSDLRNRVSLIARYPNATLVSIHQNQFPDARFSGPQVFYADTPGSKALAKSAQQALHGLAPGNQRRCRQAEGVYLMEHVACRAILVECGFLSNPREEALLRDPNYQKKLCCVLASVLAGAQTQAKFPASA